MSDASSSTTTSSIARSRLLDALSNAARVAVASVVAAVLQSGRKPPSSEPSRASIASDDTDDDLDEAFFDNGGTKPRQEDSYGEHYMDRLLADQKGLHEVSRLHYTAFIKLAAWLQDNGHIRDGRNCSARQKLLIFLMITGQGDFYRDVANQLRHSISTVSCAFHEVLTGLCELHKKVVIMPRPPRDPTALPTSIRLTGKYRLFSKCLGALDGTHIEVYVKAGPQSIRWMGRKSGTYTQNILAVVDFECRFLYVLAGYEGQAHDNTVLERARKVDGFRAPAGHYFLGDAGYTSKLIDVMVPYHKVRYHLQEHASAPNKPKDPKEVYNLRHSSLRNCVERAFGVFKRRWRIFDKKREFSMKTQVRLIYALTAVSNWIIDVDELDEDGGMTPETALDLHEDAAPVSLDAARQALAEHYEHGEPLQEGMMRVARGQQSPMEKLRDQITIMLWNNSQSVTLAREGRIRLPTSHQARHRAAATGNLGSSDPA